MIGTGINMSPTVIRAPLMWLPPLELERCRPVSKTIWDPGPQDILPA